VKSVIFYFFLWNYESSYKVSLFIWLKGVEEFEIK
jgi:hypothetical protein